MTPNEILHDQLVARFPHVEFQFERDEGGTVSHGWGPSNVDTWVNFEHEAEVMAYVPDKGHALVVAKLPYADPEFLDRLAEAVERGFALAAAGRKRMEQEADATTRAVLAWLRWRFGVDAGHISTDRCDDLVAFVPFVVLAVGGKRVGVSINFGNRGLGEDRLFAGITSSVSDREEDAGPFDLSDPTVFDRIERAIGRHLTYLRGRMRV